MKRTYRTWTTKDKLAVAKDYKDNILTMKQISEKHKCSYARVYKYVNDMKSNKVILKKNKFQNKTFLFEITALIAELKKLTNEYYIFQKREVK
jgi:transposase-like protein